MHIVQFPMKSLNCLIALPAWIQTKQERQKQINFFNYMLPTYYRQIMFSFKPDPERVRGYHAWCLCQIKQFILDYYFPMICISLIKDIKMACIVSICLTNDITQILLSNSVVHIWSSQIMDYANFTCKGQSLGLKRHNETQ